MSWEAKGKTATSGFGRNTATGSNWNGSGISAGKAENFSHVEARNIYLTGQSPKDAESSKIASKHHPPRGSSKYATKMNYFMETMDRKSQIQQLELQNRQLRIEFKKARQSYLEMQYRDRIRVESDDEEDDLHEREAFADNVVSLRNQIGDLKDELITKSRELEGLKLVRKEISERELKHKAEIVDADCEIYRAQAFKLMQKYPGYGEQEGMDEEDHHTYRFNNLALGEYDALLNELVQTLEKVELHKKNRLDDREKINERVMRLKEEGHRQALHLRECEETIIGMEQTIQMNTKYSKEEIEKLRKVRDELHNKQLTLDDELTNLKKSDENIQKNRNNHTEVIEAKINSLQKDYETALQKFRREASDDLSEDNSKKDQEQLGAISEKKKVEKLKPVRFSQIEGTVGDLNRRLFVRRIHIDDAFEHLIANEDRDMGQNDIMLSTLEVNLRKEPFLLGKEEAKLVARYLVEDNFEETVEYDSKRIQSKVTARSIFKTMIGPLEILPLDTLRKMFKIIDEKVKEKKAIISSKLQDKEKKETVPIAKFVEEIKAPTSGLADMDELVKKLMIDTMIERAEGNKEIRIASLYENFTEAQFDEFFVNMAAKSPSRKLAHKKTVVSNMSRPMSKRGSQSDQGDDHKKIDLKNLPNEDNSKSRTFNELSDRDSASKHNLRTKSNIPIKEANIEFSNSDESRDISRESDDGPPPQMFVKQVDTFNDPKTKEMILSLEQIKAAGQVKNAIGMMMFGKKPTQTGVDTGKADQKHTANPFSIGLIKKATSQESVKVNPFSSLAKDRGAIIENVKPATDSHAQPPVQSAIGKPTAQAVDTGKHEDVKQPQTSKQPLMLSVDGDDDDDDDEDDEIDRMLQENKDFDEY